jgi:hypothetical protein
LGRQIAGFVRYGAEIAVVFRGRATRPRIEHFFAEEVVASLSISSISLPAFGFLTGVLPPIGRERPALIIRLLEVSLLVATDVALVGPSVDQFAFG